MTICVVWCQCKSLWCVKDFIRGPSAVKLCIAEGEAGKYMSKYWGAQKVANSRDCVCAWARLVCVNCHLPSSPGAQCSAISDTGHIGRSQIFNKTILPIFLQPDFPLMDRAIGILLDMKEHYFSKVFWGFSSGSWGIRYQVHIPLYSHLFDRI